MDIIQVQQKIQAYIKSIELQCKKIDEAGRIEAEAARDYDKAMASAILKLRAEDHPVTVIDKLAKGMCQEELFNKIVAERGYKSCITKIDAAKSCLNAWQSINRYLETV